MPFLIFVNCKGPYLCPCFGIAFRQLGVIPRTRNKFNEITVVAECYLITNQVKNKESKKLPFRICLPVKLAGGSMSIENGKKFFVSNLQHCQFKQDGWKTFSMKVSWTWNCSQIFRKFSYRENKLLFWMILNKTPAHLKNLGNNIYTRKSYSTNIYLFKVNDRSNS